MQDTEFELQSFNPATGDVIWQGNNATLEDIDSAIQNAQLALKTWSKLNFNERLGFLEKHNEILKENKEELAKTIAMETGKPLWESLTEVNAMLGKLNISVKACEARYPENKAENNGITSYIKHKPHGVVAVIGPYNFPGHLPNGHIIPALLAGNTIVFKPSELTPLVAEKLVQYFTDANLPKGVLNLIQGNGDVGKALVEHPQLDGVFFTGSADTGHKIQNSLARYPQRIIALEMGGNNPLIFYKCSDIKAAVYNTIQSAFITAGQRCTCARRLILIRDDTSEKFVTELVSATEKILVGRYTDSPEPFMGSVISNKAATHVIDMQAKLIEDGGKALLTCKRLSPDSAIITPGIIDTTNVIERSDEEIFGPLLQIIWVNNFEEAIAEANNTAYGLSAGIFTDERSVFDEFYNEIRAGIVNWNRPLTGASSSAPFGGIGHSGNHRPSAFYAADYCAYPVASMIQDKLSLPENLSPGIKI